MPVTTPAGHPAVSISDIVAMPDRAVAIEGETNSLLTFTFDGRLQSRVPNTGPGGAMVAYPVQMALSDRGEILVLDGQTPRLARFVIHNARPELIANVRLSGLTGVSGVCALGESTYVAGAILPIASSKLVHVVTAKGQVTSSFGDAFGGQGEIDRILYGATRLLCLPRERLVILAPKSYPEVRAYDSHGVFRWKQVLPDFHKVSYIEPEPGQIKYTYPPDGLWDQTISIFSPADGVLAVQAGRRRAEGAESSFIAIRTTFLSTADGHIVGEQMDLPFVKTSAASRLFAIEKPGVITILPFSTGS
jgi:hypothetical protein